MDVPDELPETLFPDARSASWDSRRPLAVHLVVRGLIAGALCIAPGACSTNGEGDACERGAPFDTARPNVIVVSVDTLRADHLSTYGYFRDTSPFLTELADAGILFEDALTVMSHTLPTHVSLFTGVHPLSHEVLSNSLVFEGAFPTLAQTFREVGYTTGGFVGGIPLNEGTGVGHGFETWVDTGPAPWEEASESGAEGVEDDPYKLSGDVVNARVRHWLAEADPGQPVFLFVHYFDVHEPWDVPEDDPGFPDRPLRPWMESVGITTDRVRDVSPVALKVNGSSVGGLVDAIEAYDASVRQVDGHLRELEATLRAAGRLDRAFLVVTADHGEGLGQHDLFSHGLHLYEEQVRVPMVVRLYGSTWEPRRVAEPVSILDLYPTMRELAGLPGDPVAQGRSLVDAMFGCEGDAERGLLLRRRFFRDISFKRRGRQYATNVPLQVLRTDRWKYFLAGDGEEHLYDLERDPHELEDVLGREPEVADALRARLLELQRTYAGASRGQAPETEDEHLRKALEDLGYVGEGPDREADPGDGD